MATEQPSILQVLGMGQAQSAPPPKTATAAVSGGSAQPSIFDTLGIEPSAKAAPKTPAISMPTRQPKAAQPTEAPAPADVPTAANLARKPPMAGVPDQPPLWKTDVATAAKEVGTGAADILGSVGDIEHMATGAIDQLTGHKQEGTLFPTSDTLEKTFDNAWVNRYAAPGAHTAGHVLGVAAGLGASPSAFTSLLGGKTVQAAKVLAKHASNVGQAMRFLSKPEQAAAAQAAQKVQVDAANRLATLEQTATAAADTFAKQSADRISRIAKIAPKVEARTAAGVQQATLQRGASTEELGQNMRGALKAREASLISERDIQWNADKNAALAAVKTKEAAGQTLDKVPEFKALREKLKNEQQDLAAGSPLAQRFANVRLQMSGRRIPLGQQEQAALDQGLEADIPSSTPMTAEQLYTLRRQLKEDATPGAEGFSSIWASRARDLVREIDDVLEKHAPGYNTARQNYAANSRKLDAFEAKPGVAATKTVSPYGADIHATEAKFIPQRAFSSKESVQHLVNALGHSPEEKAAAQDMVNSYARTHFTEQLAGKSSTQIRDYLTKNREVMQATGTYKPFEAYANKLQKVETWAKDRETLGKNLANELEREEAAKTGSLSAQDTAARNMAQSFKAARTIIQSSEPDKAIATATNWANSALKQGTISRAEYHDMIQRIQTADNVFAHAKNVQILRRTLAQAIGVGFVGYALHRLQFNFLTNMTR